LGGELISTDIELEARTLVGKLDMLAYRVRAVL
jgi:hypothetical protein